MLVPTVQWRGDTVPRFELRGTYAAATRTVRWGLGTVGTKVSGTLSLTARIGATVPIGTTIVNQAQFSGALTFSPPAAAVTEHDLLRARA